MRYFKWSGVLAIRTMQCIPMLFLYNTLHLVGQCFEGKFVSWYMTVLMALDPADA
jgi:hypothetical protein